MNYRGREIDPIAFWRTYCPEIDEEKGPFLNLTFCPNPDHDNSRSPAFQINVHQPMVHCFRYCGISGSYEHAVCVIEGLYEKFGIDPDAPTKDKRRAYREARRKIFRHTRLHAPKKVLDKPNRRNGNSDPLPAKQAERYDELSRYSYLPPVAVEYLGRRGIRSSGISKFGIGWDVAEGRIVIPLSDERKRTVGLIRRAVKPNDHPKYLYTEGFDRNTILFGVGQLDLGLVQSSGLILVEGSFDAIHNHEVGLPNTASILGSRISERQSEIIARLRPPRIYLMFDKDSAGIGAILSAKERLTKFPLFVVRYPKGKSDPAELEREEAHRAIERALPWLHFKRLLPKELTMKGA